MINIEKILNTFGGRRVVRIEFDTQEELEAIKKGIKKGFGHTLKSPEGW